MFQLVNRPNECDISERSQAWRENEHDKPLLKGQEGKNTMLELYINMKYGLYRKPGS